MIAAAVGVVVAVVVVDVVVAAAAAAVVVVVVVDVVVAAAVDDDVACKDFNLTCFCFFVCGLHKISLTWYSLSGDLDSRTVPN